MRRSLVLFGAAAFVLVGCGFLRGTVARDRYLAQMFWDLTYPQPVSEVWPAAIGEGPDGCDCFGWCKPCTQVPSCLSSCETCELCVGKATLPSSCTSQTCTSSQACGLPGQAACPAGQYCITGCCQTTP